MEQNEVSQKQAEGILTERHRGKMVATEQMRKGQRHGVKKGGRQWTKAFGRNPCLRTSVIIDVFSARDAITQLLCRELTLALCTEAFCGENMGDREVRTPSDIWRYMLTRHKIPFAQWPSN